MTEPDDDKTQTHIVLTKGAMVSHYRIVEKIGAGGMGEVYLADDTELDRKVALKFLPSHLCQDEDCRARFKREAQAAAKLNHPNIITIHEVGEYQNRPFFVMEHVEGRSLRDVKSEELDFDRIVGIAIQLCDGLQTAHAAGITHRDIKPSNIVIDSSGRPKLLDFGLATVQGGKHLTKTGSTLGTVGYMAPEQIEGRATDARSDLFSLGVVLYELIAGRSPFRRDDETATLKAILQDSPEPLARYKSDVPDDLQRIITKLLEKDPALRYQSAAGIIPDLKRLSPSSSSRVPVEKKPDWWNRYVVPSAAVVLLIVFAFWYFGDRDQTQDTSSTNERKMLAVLPFENLGNAEDEGFADGMTDAITSRIARISGLGVIARTSVLQYKGTTKRIQEIGAELGVGYVLEGTILWDRSGDTARVRIIPQLIQVSDESHIWTETYERALTGIFEVQASIATSIAENLDVTLLQPEREALADRPTENMEAYQAFLAGERTSRDSRKILMYERAIRLDSSFALAFAGLSKAHSAEYHWGRDHTQDRLSKAKAAVDRAFELQPDLPEAHLALGYYHYWGHLEYEEALKELAIAEQSLPNDPNILGAEAYIWRRQGRWEEAAENLERAFELDPNNGGVLRAITTTYWLVRDYPKAIRLADQGISVFPETSGFHRLKFWMTISQEGDLVRARAVLSDAPGANWARLDSWSDWTLLNVYEKNYHSALDCIDSVKAEYWSSVNNFRTMAGTRGLIFRYMGDSVRALTAFDSAQTFLESHAEEFDNYNGFHSEWGRVFAGLGRKEEAIREGELALDLVPVSKDVFRGARRTHDLAQIYVMIGEYDRAIELLDTLMSIPSSLSAPELRLHPHWDPLRDHARFQALIEKYETKRGI